MCVTESLYCTPEINIINTTSAILQLKKMNKMRRLKKEKEKILNPF